MQTAEAPRFPHLQSAISLGGRTVRNRLAHASIVTVLADRGRVTDRLLRYYSHRAQGGAGLIVSEPIAMTERQQVPNWVCAWSDDAQQDLRRWADAVERHDCRLLGQLVDRGRGRNVPGRNPDAIGASALPDDLSLTMPRPLATDEVLAMIREFASSAARLQRCGFSGVEISAGHGHLIHQFLSARMNRRTDAFGGDLEGRTRLLRELIAAIRERCGSEFIVAVKLPGCDGLAGSIDEEAAGAIARRVTESGQVDLVSFAQGSHSHVLERHVPDDHSPRVPYLDQLKRLRPFVRAHVAALGRITDPAEAEGILARGEADMVALGRALIADPAWFDKAVRGKTHAIRYCVSCNTCWERTTALRLPIGCDNNPLVAEPGELEARPAPASVRKHVVVVGGGIAGMEAAWTAAARGHRVTVLSRGDEVGGKARLRAALPGGESLSSVYDFQHAQALQWGVRIQGGVQADAEQVQALGADAVVLAAGATMVPPPWLPPELLDAGWVPDLRQAMAGLARHAQRQAGTAVVWDMDSTEGTYAAVQRLHQLFERVVIVTPRESIAQDTSVVTRQGIFRRLSLLGTEIDCLSEIDCTGLEDGFIRSVHLHSQRVRTIDSVAFLAYATPRAPDEALRLALARTGIELHVVGDSRNARGVWAATTEGHAAGMAV